MGKIHFDAEAQGLAYGEPQIKGYCRGPDGCGDLVGRSDFLAHAKSHDRIDQLEHRVDQLERRSRPGKST